jgi:hypothetical protein
MSVIDDREVARERALRKAKFLNLTHCVIAHDYGGDTIVFDAGSRAGYPGWEYDAEGSRREATDEELVMWALLPDPPGVES